MMQLKGDLTRGSGWFRELIFCSCSPETFHCGSKLPSSVQQLQWCQRWEGEQRSELTASGFTKALLLFWGNLSPERGMATLKKLPTHLPWFLPRDFFRDNISSLSSFPKHSGLAPYTAHFFHQRPNICYIGVNLILFGSQSVFLGSYCTVIITIIAFRGLLCCLYLEYHKEFQK